MRHRELRTEVGLNPRHLALCLDVRSLRDHLNDRAGPVLDVGVGHLGCRFDDDFDDEPGDEDDDDDDDDFDDDDDDDDDDDER